MKKAGKINLILVAALLLFAGASIFGQDEARLEDSLPSPANAAPIGVKIKNQQEMQRAFPGNSLLEGISFAGGAEAAAADYEQGRLLLIEYPTPQLSIEADNLFRAKLAENPPNPAVYYKKTGNYLVFLFGAKDEQTAMALIDQVKYQKSVQWLGEDPFWYEKYKRAEKQHLTTTSDILISTALAIIGGLLSALGVGVVCGLIFFYFKKKRRDSMEAFSDAGGMVRLNLDELSEPMPEK